MEKYTPGILDTSRGDHVNINISGLFETYSDNSVSIIQVGSYQEPLKGHVTNSCFLHNHPDERFNTNALHNVSKVKLSFIKNVNIDSPNNIIYDYTYTDINGNYTVFLEPGEYKVRVDAPGQQFFFCQVVPTGIQEYYLYPEAASIRKRIEDTIILNNTSKVFINGMFFNEYNKPHAGQIIISQNDKLVTFIDSKDGKYNFLLNYGVYDVRIRAYNRSVKVFYNFSFEPGKGFFTQLMRKNIKGLDENTIEQLIENNQLTNNLLEDNIYQHTR